MLHAMPRNAKTLLQRRWSIPAIPSPNATISDSVVNIASINIPKPYPVSSAPGG